MPLNDEHAPHALQWRPNRQAGPPVTVQFHAPKARSMPPIVYPVDTDMRPGYLAVPTGRGPWPGVVVIQDIRGMTNDLQHLTDHFADAGYLALAPNLYGRANTVRCMVSMIRSHFSGTGPTVDDIAGARDHLLADERCTGKVGIAGFCLGAGLALVVAPGRFDAVAANYGLIPNDLTAVEQSCPVVASFGAKDPIAKAGSADKLHQALTAAGVPNDVKEYPNAGHAFMNSTDVPAPIRHLLRMEYSGPEADDAWRRVFAFFGEHLT